MVARSRVPYLRERRRRPTTYTQLRRPITFLPRPIHRSSGSSIFCKPIHHRLLGPRLPRTSACPITHVSRPSNQFENCTQRIILPPTYRFGAVPPRLAVRAVSTKNHESHVSTAPSATVVCTTVRFSTPVPGSDSVSAKLAAQAILDEWQDAALYLSAHVGVGRLVLSLVCDIDPDHPYALEAARLATTPIAFFPRLEGCHIWLCKMRN
jgi:hypothetical protein